MLRSKVPSILRNTVSRNLYNNGHPGICALFSSNSSDTILTELFKEIKEKNRNVTAVKSSQKTLDENIDATPIGRSQETLDENIDATPIGNSKVTWNNDMYISAAKSTTTIRIKKPIETSSTSSEKSQPDKLYRKVEVEIKGHDPAVMKSYTIFATAAAKHLEIKCSNVINLGKPVLNRLTVLKSAHVHKNHRVQYETRTYYNFFEIYYITGSTADTYIEYIQRNLPEGIAMKVTKVELDVLPEKIEQNRAVEQNRQVQQA